MIPGEIIVAPGTITLNAGREAITLMVANTGDRPVQVGSHYHFAEANPALDFDRGAARGRRLDIAAGTAVFAALGLLLGGTLRAEIVLALANLLWFVFAGLGALTVEGQSGEDAMVPSAVAWVARLTPSGALTEALSQAMTSEFPASPCTPR